MQRIKLSRGLRISVLAAILIALLLCFTLGVAADEQTELEISLGKLNFAGTGITVGDTVSKTYDGTDTVATLPVLTEQPAGIDGAHEATVAVDTVKFNSADAGEKTLTITFQVTGADADKYVVKPLVVDAKILPKQLTWAANAALNIPYQRDNTTYTGYIAAANLPAFTEPVAGLGSSDAQIAVTFSASKAGNYTAQATVHLNSGNYTAPLLTVDVTVTKIELTQVDWAGITGLKYGDTFSPVLTGYDAANTAYPVLTYEAPAGYANGNAGTYTFTAKLLDTDNYTLAAGAVGKTQAVTINPAVYAVSFTSKTVITDGKTPNMISVLGDEIPVDVLALITYKVNNAAFAGTAETGSYEIVATLPDSVNYSFVNGIGQEVTSMTATMTVKTDHLLVPVADADSSVILTASEGIGKATSATAKKAEPEALPSKTKNYEALTVTVNGAAGETYAIFVPIASTLYGKRYDEITAANVYVYADGKPVEATSKGYTVTVGEGFVKIEGLGSGEATFLIAPTFHPAFFTTAPGIALIILLIILLLILMFLLGLYVRRVLESGRTLTTVIDTEGEAPAEETPAEEAPVEEAPAEEEPVEEPEEEPAEEEAEADQDALAAAVAAAFEEAKEEEPQEEPAVAAVAEAEAEEEDAGLFGDDGIVFIDTKANPEEYQKMLEQEAAGEGQVIYRYKRTFLSRLAQSQGSVQDYYNGIKNALLSYKGVKSRVSAGYDAFNKGRFKVAKINSKVKTLYVYLAIDPESIKDTKYNAIDVSDKKKFAATPALMKIRGDRKFKYTLELIESLCAGQLECKKLEKEPEDFRVPYATTEELVESGLIRKFAGLAPLSYSASFIEPDDEPEEDVNEEEAEEIAADAPATDETTPDTNA